MTTLRSQDTSSIDDFLFSLFSTQHPSFRAVFEIIQKWKSRFPYLFNESVYNELTTLFNFVGKSYLDHHSPEHLSRLIISFAKAHTDLLRELTSTQYRRHVFVKFIATHIDFSFVSKKVLGCVLGVTLKNPLEAVIIDDLEQLIELKFPCYQIVSNTKYSHPSPYSNVALFYLEIEKKDHTLFSPNEKKELKGIFEDKLSGDLPHLVRPIFKSRNQEEIYKNILLMSQEIHSSTDLPHVRIILDEQKEGQLIFLITLISVSPKKPIDLSELFFREDSSIKFALEQSYPIKFIDKQYPVIGHLFRLHVPYSSDVLRSDGSLDFYQARKKVVSFLNRALGEFRDCNGGLILKLEEQLSSLKDFFKGKMNENSETIETFFYSITPLEKQATLSFSHLEDFFNFFL